MNKLCKQDNCNTVQKIEEKIVEVNKLHLAVEGGAAQSTVAIATIAFNMVIARPAL